MKLKRNLRDRRRTVRWLEHPRENAEKCRKFQQKRYSFDRLEARTPLLLAPSLEPWEATDSRRGAAEFMPADAYQGFSRIFPEIFQSFTATKGLISRRARLCARIFSEFYPEFHRAMSGSGCARSKTDIRNPPKSWNHITSTMHNRNRDQTIGAILQGIAVAIETRLGTSHGSLVPTTLLARNAKLRVRFGFLLLLQEFLNRKPLLQGRRFSAGEPIVNRLRVGAQDARQF